MHTALNATLPSHAAQGDEAATNGSGQLIHARTIVLTTVVEFGVSTTAALVAWGAYRVWPPGGVLLILAGFGIGFVASTLVALMVIRNLRPLAPGVYSCRDTSAAFSVWVLQTFLSVTNLSFLHVSGLVPAVLRGPFYALMGGKFAPGFVNVAGRMHDPWMVSVGTNVQIGDDALILGHVVNLRGVVVVGRVNIQADALIGVRSVIMPGVTVGRGSIVNAMSFVPMHTQIPPYEVWGGIPAVKVRDLPRPKPTEQP